MKLYRSFDELIGVGGGADGEGGGRADGGGGRLAEESLAFDKVGLEKRC